MSASLGVLHVAPYFEEAWAYGGIPRVVSRLARGLCRLGHRVSVFTTDAKGPGERWQPDRGEARDADGLSVSVFPNLLPSLAHRHQFFTPRGLRRRLARGLADFDIAHLHACHNLPVALAARRLQSDGVPYVLHPNGTAARIEQRRFVKAVFDLLFARSLLPRAAAVIATSESERQQLVGLGLDAAKIHLLPNPLDLEELEPPPLPGALTRRWPGDGPCLLYLGQLTPRKGLRDLVAALAILPRDVRLAIFGADRGVAGELALQIEELGLGERARIFGVVEGRERFSLLRDADLLIYPSRMEVFGLSAFEALLVGTPVVVGNDSGCGELVERYGGGITVEPGQPEALAAAIARALKEKEALADEACEAATRLRRDLGAVSVCEELEALYREILARRRP